MSLALKQIPEISVIVPIYNTAPYLQICLQAIAMQTYSSFEVILVDDGSTDNSSEICKKYVEADSRFHYFFKKNEGQATARNLGLKHARGNFISFIDSDDFVHQDYLKIMVETIKQENADIVVSEFFLWKSPYLLDPICFNTKKPYTSTEDQKTFRYGIFSLLNNSKSPTIFGGHVANKLFRSHVLQGVYFKNWKVEDEIFLFEVTRNISKVVYIWEKMYFYRQRQFSSIKARGFNRAILEEREYLLTQCKTDEEESCVRQAIVLQVYKIIVRSLFHMSASDVTSSSDLEFLRQSARKTFSYISLSEISPTITKFKLLCLRLIVFCPTSCMKVLIFISRKVCFFPTIIKFLRNYSRC